MAELRAPKQPRIDYFNIIYFLGLFVLAVYVMRYVITNMFGRDPLDFSTSLGQGVGLAMGLGGLYWIYNLVASDGLDRVGQQVLFGQRARREMQLLKQHNARVAYRDYDSAAEAAPPAGPGPDADDADG
jgi:hypothetical protein